MLRRRRSLLPPSSYLARPWMTIVVDDDADDTFEMIPAPHLKGGLLVLVLIISISEAQTTRQTVYSLQGYSDLQPCAQSCIMDPDSCRVGGIDQIAINIGCQYNWCSSDLGAAESCYCRPDLQTVATKYLTKCVTAACTLGDPNIELSSAVNLYQGYCSSKGYLATPASAPASTTVAGGATTTATKTVYVTVTANSSHSYSTTTLPIFISVRAVDTPKKSSTHYKWDLI
jgi:hypothetical protein